MLPPVTAGPNDAGRTTPADRATQIRRLVASARRLMAVRRWDQAADTLARALDLDPRNREVETLIGELARARRDTSVVAIQPPPPVLPAADTATAPPAPPPKRVNEAEVRAALDQYVGAINARNLAQLRAVFPAISGKQESDWKDRFSREIKNLAATLTVGRIDGDEDAAQASFELSLVLEPNGQKPMTYRIQCNATLRQEGGAWKIMSLSERGA